MSASLPRWPALLLASSTLALGLSACVSVPKDDIATPLALKDIAFEQTLGGANGTWPQTLWWQAFRDPQLDGLIAEAMKGNPTLKIMDARVEKAVALQNQVNAALYPSADLQGAIVSTKQSSNNGFPAQFVPKGYLTASKLTVNGNYNLDLWGKSKAARNNTKLLAQAQAVDAQAARLSLTANIAKSYVELDRLYKETDIITTVKKGAVKKLELIRSRVANHLEPADHMLVAEQELAQLETRLYALEGAARLQKNLLASLAGKGPDRGLDITRPNLSGAPVSELPADLGLNLLARRPDIAAAKLRVAATSEGFTYAKADYLPQCEPERFLGRTVAGLARSV
jgi:NodT family efflux transporter outer membrane factor (OMF) lipoprotein